MAATMNKEAVARLGRKYSKFNNKINEDDYEGKSVTGEQLAQRDVLKAEYRQAAITVLGKHADPFANCEEEEEEDEEQQ